MLVVTGAVQMRNEEPTILCDEATPFKGLEEEMNRKQYEVWITLKLSGPDDLAVSNDKLRVREISCCVRDAEGHDHDYPLVENGEWQAHLTPGQNTTHDTPAMRERLVAILKGMGEVKVEMVAR